MEIPQHEITHLLETIKTAMGKKGLPSNLIEGTRIVAIHPEYWEVSLLVPSANTKASEIRKWIEDILYRQCNVEERCCDYLGKQKAKQAYEWYFRHPNTPQPIYEQLEVMLEEALGGEVGFGLPQPNGFKSKTDTVFLTLKDEFFTQIKDDRKRTEYRTLNQYYCDKFFSPGIAKRYVKFNRGYLSGEENQMLFEIAEIVLVSEDGQEISPYDSDGHLIVSYSKLPRHFVPVAYGIRLGKRVE